MASEYSASASANSVTRVPRPPLGGTGASPSRDPTQTSADAISTSTAAAAAGWNRPPQLPAHAARRSSSEAAARASRSPLTRARTAAQTAGGGSIGSSVCAAARMARTSARPARGTTGTPRGACRWRPRSRGRARRARRRAHPRDARTSESSGQPSHCLERATGHRPHTAQQHAQLHPRLVHLRFRRALRDPERDAHLAVVEPLDVVQHEGGAAAVGQLGDRALEIDARDGLRAAPARPRPVRRRPRRRASRSPRAIRDCLPRRWSRHWFTASR